MPDNFTTGLILKTMFLYITDAPGLLAGFCLKCHISLVYKWMRDEVPLPRKHVPAIVNFVMDKTESSDRIQLRGNLETLLFGSPLRGDTKKTIAVTMEFGDFKTSILEQSILLRKSEQLEKRAQEKLIRSEPTIFKMTRLIIFGFFGIASGGALWSLANLFFGFNHYMGGSGNEPTGIISVLWGILSVSPIILFAVLSVSKANENTKRALNLREKAALIVLYSLFGGLGAFVFYNCGYRTLIESLGFWYGIQEFLVAFVYALILSSLPMLAPLILLTRLRMPVWYIPAGAGLCSVAASLTAMGTWLVGRPDPEVSQLRGFAVALVLRLCMFVMTYLAVSGRIQHIKLSAVSSEPNALHKK